MCIFFIIRNICIDEVNVFFMQCFDMVVSIREVGVIIINDDVIFVEQWNQLFDEVINYLICMNYQYYFVWCCQFIDQFLQSVSVNNVSVFCWVFQKFVYFSCGMVVCYYFEVVVVYVEDQVLVYYCKVDYIDIIFYLFFFFM